MTVQETTIPAGPPARRSETSRSDRSRPATNVGVQERLLSATGGTLLAVNALRRGGLNGIAMFVLGAFLVRRGFTGHCGVYEKLGVHTDSGAPQPSEFHERGIHVVKAFTINKPAAELFRFWRDFENLPRFMTHLLDVKTLDEKHSHWKARAPAGFVVEWDAEIISEEPDRSISWRSLDGSDVHSAGSVRFVDTGDRGTEVRVVLDYIPPAGQLGALVARVFGEEPSQQINEDLRHFKQLMETGEMPTAKGPRGKCSAQTVRWS